MYYHPFITLTGFTTATYMDVIVRALAVPTSIPYALIGILGKEFCTLPLAPLNYPSSIIRSLAKKSGLTRRKIDWIAPVLGISLLALAGRAAFDLTPNHLLKGLIYGLYTGAMGKLTIVPSDDKTEIITLFMALGNYVQLPSALDRLFRLCPLNERSVWETSDSLASFAFIITSVALSIFGGFHMMMVNMIAHVIAATTFVVAARVLAMHAEKHPRCICNVCNAKTKAVQADKAS